MADAFSIVVSTYHRKRLLSRCLDHISRLQTIGGEVEVLVMDNGNDPATGRLVEGYSRIIANLRYQAVTTPGLHACRNAGFDSSDGDILCYLDDDVFVESTWLAGVAEGFSKKGTVLVGGPIFPEYESAPPDWFERLWVRNRYGKFMAHHTLIDFGKTECHIPPRFVWGCNFSIRRCTLADSGGFHPDSLPQSLIRFRGDGESAVSRFISNKGERARYIPGAAVTHWVSRDRLGEDYLLHRAYLQGVSDSYSRLRSRNGNVRGSYPYYLYALCRDHLERMVRRNPEKTSGIVRRMRGAYWRGFRFHVRESRRDPLLREWVCRRDYFGKRGMVPVRENRL